VQFVRKDLQVRTLLYAHLLLVATVTTPALLARAKTDLVVMKNGDKITCEIVKLTRRQLQIKTSYAIGTITLNWDAVAHVESKQAFLVEDVHGINHSGAIKTTAPSVDQLVVEDRGGPVTVGMSEVSVINQLGESFVRSLRAKIDFGTSYTSSNDLRQLTISGELGRFAEKHSFRTYGTALLNRQTGVAATTSAASTSEYFRTISRNWLLGTQLDFQRNDQQQLDLRTTIAGVGGRHLIRSGRTSLIGLGGLVRNRERYSDTPAATHLEGVAGFRYQFFRFDSTQVSTDVRLYPSISEPGRNRLQIDTNVYLDLWGDLYFKFGVSDSFDSRPPTGSPKNNIFVTTGLGWKW
jgi:hypothetical protein